MAPSELITFFSKPDSPNENNNSHLPEWTTNLLSDLTDDSITLELSSDNTILIEHWLSFCRVLSSTTNSTIGCEFLANFAVLYTISLEAGSPEFYTYLVERSAYFLGSSSNLTIFSELRSNLTLASIER